MFWQDKRVLITGINGFLGRHIEESLIKQGGQIHGFGRKYPDNETRNNTPSSRRFITGNIDSESSIYQGISSCEPEVIFHLAAQSSVANSFQEPSKTCITNCLGTSNLLEAVCKSNLDPTIIFAGSSDEYGLVFSTEDQYTSYIQEFGEIDNPPHNIPEVPISEINPLRPLSPYAVSKVYGDLLMRNYHRIQGMKTVVCRSFNVEGAGRGDQYVTSVIAKQVAKLQQKLTNKISIGNINPIRDFSHVNDIINGYKILAEQGHPGTAYNLGSMRGFSVATYLLTCLVGAGYPIDKIVTNEGATLLNEPLKEDNTSIFGSPLPVSSLDKRIIHRELYFSRSDSGFIACSGDKKIQIEFDPNKFRPADIPILIADTRKISKIGFQPTHTLQDIVNDQLQFYQRWISNSLSSTSDMSPGDQYQENIPD